MLNIDLLRAIVDWALTEDPKGSGSQWDQSSWARLDGTAAVDTTEVLPRHYRVTDVDCGTTLCLAGNACVMAGDTLLVRSSEWTLASELVNLTVEVRWVLDADDGVHLIADRAAALLGITATQAAHLFYVSNTLDDVLDAARGIAAEYGLTLNR